MKKNMSKEQLAGIEKMLELAPWEGGKPLVKKRKYDGINHPKHYNTGSIESINVIEDWKLGYHLGNCVKYICRAPHKGNELADLKKARWYLTRYIEHYDRTKI